MPNTRLALIPFVLITALLLACGGGGGSDYPEGWKSFSAGPFSGGVDKDWNVVNVDVSKGAANLPKDVPQAIVDAVEGFAASGNAEVFFIFLDDNEEFATNLNILGCESADAKEIVSSGKTLVDYYKSQGVAAAVSGQVKYDGRSFDLIQLKVTSDLDSYQVYLEKDGCYMPATLTTRLGETQPLADFRTFLSFLKINPAKFK
ncbi:MAG TPA: hypothetical protein VI759_00620 [Dehalococcoidia bacterium]|nr:hypothetical protein [Dehalococcoidia bacterium]